MTQETKKTTQQGGVSVPTGTRSQPKNVLTQEELKAWWPFTRLDPQLMPKQSKLEYEECLF
jgi:hypothetical protein